ncbi:RNA polymerase sigma factor SigB [Anaerobacillus alkalidiazotrophicus]|uniref:RNA polymerase sigma factor n=1 Tax=Anaerobacillus alkalidiazotrophicus TaxID=472963 RepID=A0A1S2MAK3_9BACI|nr:RNA polymerase sigma factor SigB [Anaerobacillus alkalidiazotrophicus]OIJ21533.1 RNA polymerase sigma factor SigB [Anaerobacillus alkalidiazotrophicus]
MSEDFQQQLQIDNQIEQLIKDFQRSNSEETQVILVKRYEALVYMLARKFSKGKDYGDDLIQVGMIGLLAALRRFDSSYGRSFESYAVPTIIGEIKRYIRDKTWSVHVPRRIKELGPKIKNAVEKLTTELQRSPKVYEIAGFLDVTEEEVLETMEMSRSYHALSVDRSIDTDQEGGTVTLLDLVGATDTGYERTDQQLLIEKVFSVLNDMEKQILYCVYYEGLSQKEIGKKLGISQMHVSRLQRRALEKVQKSLPTDASES